MTKEYQLVSNEPLTEFDQSVLQMLNGVAKTGTPKAMVGAVLTEEEEVVTFYHNATLADMMIARGYLDLDIVNDNILGNLPFYMEQAEKDGLIESYPDDGDGLEEGEEDEE